MNSVFTSFYNFLSYRKERNLIKKHYDKKHEISKEEMAKIIFYSFY